jgi:hypothetical protein
MTSDANASEPISQIETSAGKLRVVLLGASNLSIMFPTVVATARATFAQPLEMFVAKGFGRSYGQQSKFFGKKFPGILQSHLWSAMERTTPSSSVAILADIGNDLAYEAPVGRIIGWVQQALDRLQTRGAQVVLNNIPLESLRRVGVARYHIFREALFPSCKLGRRELLRRAEGLSKALIDVGEQRKIPIFAGESAWYGVDPIHPRWSAAGRIWARMLGELSAPGAIAPLVRASSSMAVQLHRLKPESWLQLGFQRRAGQPAARLSDGTTIALY